MSTVLSDLKWSLRWALSGIVIGITAFCYNYYFIASVFPGYGLITAPARFSLSFFSEETAFWPKMSIFLSGQYFGYLIIIFTMKRLFLLLKKS